MHILITLISLTAAVVSIAYALTLRRRYQMCEQPNSSPLPTECEDDITRKVDAWMWTTLAVPYDNSITLDSIAEGIGIERTTLQDYLLNPYVSTTAKICLTPRTTRCPR